MKKFVTRHDIYLSDMILVGKKKAEISKSDEKKLKNNKITLISRSKISEISFSAEWEPCLHSHNNR